jgi:hypothetical protein
MFRICAASLVQTSFIEMDDLKSDNERNLTLASLSHHHISFLISNFPLKFQGRNPTFRRR